LEKLAALATADNLNKGLPRAPHLKSWRGAISCILHKSIARGVIHALHQTRSVNNYPPIIPPDPILNCGISEGDIDELLITQMKTVFTRQTLLNEAALLAAKVQQDPQPEECTSSSNPVHLHRAPTNQFSDLFFHHVPNVTPLPESHHPLLVCAMPADGHEPSSSSGHAATLFKRQVRFAAGPATDMEAPAAPSTPTHPGPVASADADHDDADVDDDDDDDDDPFDSDNSPTSSLLAAIFSPPISPRSQLTPDDPASLSEDSPGGLAELNSQVAEENARFPDEYRLEEVVRYNK
jgi:hypothetical protein